MTSLSLAFSFLLLFLSDSKRAKTVYIELLPRSYQAADLKVKAKYLKELELT